MQKDSLLAMDNESSLAVLLPDPGYIREWRYYSPGGCGELTLRLFVPKFKKSVDMLTSILLQKNVPVSMIKHKGFFHDIRVVSDYAAVEGGDSAGYSLEAFLKGIDENKLMLYLHATWQKEPLSYTTQLLLAIKEYVTPEDKSKKD